LRWHGLTQRHIVSQRPQLFQPNRLLFRNLLAYVANIRQQCLTSAPVHVLCALETN